MQVPGAAIENASTTSKPRTLSCRNEAYRTKTMSQRLNDERAVVQREIRRPHVARLIGVRRATLAAVDGARLNDFHMLTI